MADVNFSNVLDPALIPTEGSKVQVGIDDCDCILLFLKSV